MEARCSNIVTHLQRASKKRRRPQWFDDLGVVFPDQQDEKDCDETADDDERKSKYQRQTGELKETQDQEGFFFDWREDLKLARRMRAPDGGFELSQPPAIKDGLGTTPLVATWPDGVSWVVPGWSEKRFKDHCNANRGRSKVERLWEGVAVGTSHELYISQRVDRCLLLSMYEQSKQIAQVRVDRFGTLDGDQPAQVDNSSKPVQDALAFFSPIRNRLHDWKYLIHRRSNKSTWRDGDTWA